MGPKAKAEAKVEVVGAKFAYVCAGQRSSLSKVMLNLNCNVEILLDAAKAQLHKRIEERIVLLKEAPVVAENGVAPPEGEVSKNSLMIQKLIEFQHSIQTDVGLIDLVDASGNPTGCNQVFTYLHGF